MIPNELVESSRKFIETAYQMITSCRLKKEKTITDSRRVISFFFRRSIELFESILILLEKERYADILLVLRSYWELGFSAAYIFEKSGKDKDKNALIYLLNEEIDRNKLMKCNKKDIQSLDPDIGARFLKATIRSGAFEEY